MGTEVVGFVGPGPLAARSDVPFLGTIEEIDQTVAASGAVGVMLASTILIATAPVRPASALPVRDTMSMVDLRSTLPEQVSQWDPEVRPRLRVLSGLTGLWPV